MRRAAALAIVLLLACGGARASGQAAPQSTPAQTVPADRSADDARLDLQKPEDEEPKAAESWWQQVLRAAPNCKSFTDGCRTCSHTVCSNIGIACQPKDWSCNDDILNATPEAVPDDKPKLKIKQ